MRGSVATADADKVGHARHNVKACSSSVEAADSYRGIVDPRRVNTTSLLHAIEGRHAKALLSARQAQTISIPFGREAVASRG